MNTYGISERSFKLIAEFLSSQSGIEQVILFGSRATGKAKNGSDIDLVLKGELSYRDALLIKAKLNQEIPIPYHVDVVLFDDIQSSDLLEHIKNFGKDITPTLTSVASSSEA